MLIVGLTGGIASGKSTVSKLFQSQQLPLIDLDILARQVVEPGSPTLLKLEKVFGKEIISDKDGSLNRPKLGSVIFNDEKKRKILNGIIHPAIRKRLAWLLLLNWLKGEKITVVDAPLLIEAGLWRFAGKIVLVYCSEQIQLQRLISRAGPLSSPEDARARIASQAPLSSKLIYADHIIDNSGDLAELDRQVEDVVNKLNRSVSWYTWLACWLLPPFGLFKVLLTILYRLYYKRIGQKKTRPPKAR